MIIVYVEKEFRFECEIFEKEEHFNADFQVKTLIKVSSIIVCFTNRKRMRRPLKFQPYIGRIPRLHGGDTALFNNRMIRISVPDITVVWFDLSSYATVVVSALIVRSK